MRSIQDVGTEILNNEPKKFYVFSGSEYGIKCKYIDHLKQYYGQLKNSDTVSSLITLMNTKHLIPLKPSVYVVRYDDSFISHLDNKTASEIENLNIVGTIICLYDKDDYIDKLDKFLPNYTVYIDTVSKHHINRYLHYDFPNLPDRLISVAAKLGTDYNHARNICKSMSYTKMDHLFKLPDEKLYFLFGSSQVNTEEELRIAFAARNSKLLMKFIDTQDNLDSVFYTFLSTLIELERINKVSNSNISEYVKLWTKKDIYNMFMQTYDQLSKLRSVYSDNKSALVYLSSLLQFNEIPEVGFI